MRCRVLAYTSASLSRAILLLRFPLMVAIVCIHTDFRVASQEVSQLPWFGVALDAFKNYVCFAALALFFFVSGFLFFKEQAFSPSLYFSKLRRRVKSLLVPYLLWNGLTFLAIAICQLLRPGFSLFLNKQVVDFRWYDYFLVFWDKQLITGLPGDFHGPLLLPFWFIQDLMVIVLLSPVVWFFLKHVRWLFLALLAAAALWLPMPEVAGFRPDCFFYFCLGAAFQLDRQWWAVLQRPWVPLCVALVFVPISVYCPSCILFYNIAFFFVVLSWACYLSSQTNRCVSMLESLSDSSFFIFAFHIFGAGVLLNLVQRATIAWTDGLAVLVYVSAVLLNVGVCLFANALLKRFVPGLRKVLVGGR